MGISVYHHYLPNDRDFHQKAQLPVCNFIKINITCFMTLETSRGAAMPSTFTPPTHTHTSINSGSSCSPHYPVVGMSHKCEGGRQISHGSDVEDELSSCLLTQDSNAEQYPSITILKFSCNTLKLCCCLFAFLISLELCYFHKKMVYLDWWCYNMETSPFYLVVMIYIVCRIGHCETFGRCHNH